MPEALESPCGTLARKKPATNPFRSLPTKQRQADDNRFRHAIEQSADGDGKPAAFRLRFCGLLNAPSTSLAVPRAAFCE
jgi:hypothetical protein